MGRQAIITKYHAATGARGSRVSATASAGRLYTPWDDGLSVDANHARAARAFAVKYNWHGNWHGGGMPNGTGNVYVVSDDDGWTT